MLTVVKKENLNGKFFKNKNAKDFSIFKIIKLLITFIFKINLTKTIYLVTCFCCLFLFLFFFISVYNTHSTNRLKYEIPKRHIILSIRNQRKNIFDNGSKPIPLLDSEILQDPYYKTLLSDYSEEMKRSMPGAAGRRTSVVEEEEGSTDFYFEEILRKQKIRVQSFRQKVSKAQKALDQGNRKLYGENNGMGNDAYVKEGIKPNFNITLNIGAFFKPKRRLKPSGKKRTKIAKPVTCKIRVHVINVKNAPLRYDEQMLTSTGNGDAPTSPMRRSGRGGNSSGGGSANGSDAGSISRGGGGVSQNDDDSEDEFDEDGMNNALHSFIGIEFQGQEYRTSTRQGSNPQWNEPVDLPFKPQGVEGTNFTPRNLASIR
jgi:uncharacterized membrane protein YgcG|tara:strand:- start:115 stop:1233 length:1119 start_codon:yes stop_codon:yes gene_type:complete